MRADKYDLLVVLGMGIVVYGLSRFSFTASILAAGACVIVVGLVFGMAANKAESSDSSKREGG